MTQIFVPALVIGAIGLVLGILLAVASRVFAIKQDERITKIVDALPGANCGGCGYPGCAGYAAAVVSGEANINCCAVGGQKVTDYIASVMGVESVELEKCAAIVRCNGSDEVAFTNYEYDGISTCEAANVLMGGPKSCRYGCLGYGNCVAACEYDAIKIENKVAFIDRDKCRACGKCVAICPRGIIELVPVKNKYVVKCMSCDKGAAMKEKCSAGCIGCKMCEKACEAGAITVDENHAHIDYSKCTGCGACAEKCPRKIIIKL